MTKSIVIFGAGGHGRETLWLLEQINGQQSGVARPWKVLGFIDDDAAAIGGMIHGLPVLGDRTWLDAHGDTFVALGVGRPAHKRRLVEYLGSECLPTLVHPSVCLSASVLVGAGTQVHAGTIATTDIRIGSAVTINRRVDLSHDDIIGDFATLAPSVSLAGHVHIGEQAELGIRAACIPGVRVGARAVVGAGAVVVRDIPADVIAAGVPARVLSARPTSGVALLPEH